MSYNRVWKKVIKGNKNECWLFTGQKSPYGYGQLSIHNSKMQAHRAAYLSIHGDIPSGFIIRHLCNNKLCCNPAHLQAGTYAENQRDAVDANARKPGKTGIVGVTFDTRDSLFTAMVQIERKRTYLYRGHDFFEACCARKTWEASRKVCRHLTQTNYIQLQLSK